MMKLEETTRGAQIAGLASNAVASVIAADMVGENAVNYDTRLARTADYIHWEFAPQPVISPDYGHHLTLVGHPEVFEVNVSDAEFIETNGKVKIYACGGNQLGVHDYFVAESDGPLEELFTGMFAS